MLPDAVARLFCYLLGPVSASLVLLLPRYNIVWSLRFHAYHSLFLSMLWVAVWGALRAAEKLLPWFMAVLMREFRLILNLGFGLAWILLVITAYRGVRCAAVPFVHRLAIRFAHRVL